ncbi:MAG: SRPBCC domain-containing protein [Paracoccaceae bacterium]
MPDVCLTRDFPVTTDGLYDYITRPDRLAQWFGPEGTELAEHDMDFTRTGPWFAVLVGRESGNRFKVSGQVTHVRPKTSVGLTWAWHDDADRRGAESHVTLSVAAAAKGAKLTIDHRELADAEAVESHRKGWTSTLDNLSKRCS